MLLKEFWCANNLSLKPWAALLQRELRVRRSAGPVAGTVGAICPPRCVDGGASHAPSVWLGIRTRTGRLAPGQSPREVGRYLYCSWWLWWERPSGYWAERDILQINCTYSETEYHKNKNKVIQKYPRVGLRCQRNIPVRTEREQSSFCSCEWSRLPHTVQISLLKYLLHLTKKINEWIFIG